MKYIKKSNIKVFDSNIFSININKQSTKRIFTSKYIRAIELKALGYLSKNNYIEAYKEYSSLVNIGVLNSQYYQEFAVICQLNGKIEEAYKLYIRALDRFNKNSTIHYNLGLILKENGELEKAEKSILKSIKLNKIFYKAYICLAEILRDSKKYEEAKLCLRKAIEINPIDPNSHLLLGIILKLQKQLNKSINAYINAIKFAKDKKKYCLLTIDFLTNEDIHNINIGKLSSVLKLLLKSNELCHDDLFKVFIYVHNKKYIKKSKIEDINLLENKSLRKFSEDNILIEALKKIIFKDIDLEKRLTKIRKVICMDLAYKKNKLKFNQLPFVIALASQCFLNEYIFNIDNEEKKAISIIIKRSSKDKSNELEIALLGCYHPLYNLIEKIPYLKSIRSKRKDFNELLTLQIKEPLEEIKISKNIKKISEIEDKISSLVKSQYELNPYPRWRFINTLRTNESSFDCINKEISPNFIKTNSSDQKINILIAGCGTGLQILMRKSYINEEITAVDLSSTSIAFAQRKVNEHQMNNVRFFQMDILNLGKLNKRFDIIICTGVLHHMKNPTLGLKVLLEILKPKGFLKLGLYSNLARQDVIKARSHIKLKSLLADDESIRIFRKDVMSNQFKSINNISKRPDFFSMSMCRDLCFHIQEKRFNIDKIIKIIKYNRLNFLGFILNKKTKSYYYKNFPEDITQTNLENWLIFEERYPNAFQDMYQFWLCKSS